MKRILHHLPYPVYYAALSTYAVSMWSGQLGDFGFATLRYTPGNAGLLILLAAALVPLLTLLGRSSEPASDPPEIEQKNPNSFLVLSGLLVIAYGTAFILFRCQTFFLGDSYTALAEFSKSDILIKYREIGAYLLQMNLRDMLGEPSAETSLLSFRISSILAGIFFLISLSWLAVRLIDNNRDRFQFWMGLATGGYMLLFFGYVEFYAWFVLSVALFSFAGLLICKGAINRWLILIPLSMAIFFHILGLVLLPAAAYLLADSHAFEKFLDRRTGPQKILLTTVSIVMLYLLITLFGTVSPFIKFAVLPVIENIITVDHYTLFSTRHIFDFINLLFLLLPGLALAGLLLFAKINAQSKRTIRFLAVLTASALFATFVIDPKLGLPRDWDLLSFAGVPLSLLVYYTAISLKKQNPKLVMIAPLMILLGMMSLSGRVLSQIDPATAETQFKDYLRHDPARGRNGHLILIDYYEKKGDLVRAAHESNLRKTLYPQEELLRKALNLIEQKRFEAAVNTLYKAIKIDPQYWNLWLSLGSVYREQGNSDSAVIALEIAEGLNPHSAEVKSQLAYLYYDRKDYSNAERLWLKAVKLDRRLLKALMGLATLYHEQDKIKDHVIYLTRAAACDDANSGLVANLADYYISVGNFRRATRLYDRALAMGLDSTYYNQLKEKYPELGQ